MHSLLHNLTMQILVCAFGDVVDEAGRIRLSTRAIQLMLPRSLLVPVLCGNPTLRCILFPVRNYLSTEPLPPDLHPTEGDPDRNNLRWCLCSPPDVSLPNSLGLHRRHTF